MIDFIAKSRMVAERRRMEQKKLNFFVYNSGNRLQRIKNGGRLFQVLDDQMEENREPLDIIQEFLDKQHMADNKNKHPKPLYRRKKESAYVRQEVEPLQSHQIEEYFMYNDFNPKREVIKEKNLELFFKRKYEKMSEYLRENELDEFLKDKEGGKVNYPGQGRGDEGNQLKQTETGSTKGVFPSGHRFPLNLQIAQVDAEIQDKLEAEFLERQLQERAEQEMERQKEATIQRREKFLSKGKKAPKKSLKQIAKEQNLPILYKEEDKMFDKSFEKKIERASSANKIHSREFSSTKIITEILNVGRLDFLKAGVPREEIIKSPSQTKNARKTFSGGETDKFFTAPRRGELALEVISPHNMEEEDMEAYPSQDYIEDEALIQDPMLIRKINLHKLIQNEEGVLRAAHKLPNLRKRPLTSHFSLANFQEYKEFQKLPKDTAMLLQKARREMETLRGNSRDNTQGLGDQFKSTPNLGNCHIGLHYLHLNLGEGVPVRQAGISSKAGDIQKKFGKDESPIPAGRMKGKILKPGERLKESESTAEIRPRFLMANATGGSNNPKGNRKADHEIFKKDDYESRMLYMSQGDEQRDSIKMPGFLRNVSSKYISFDNLWKSTETGGKAKLLPNQKMRVAKGRPIRGKK